jgi:DHA1 family inner membrane transport protein
LNTKLTIFSLILPILVISTPQIIISLLLVEIAFSFDIEVGVAGQLNTVAMVISAIMAVLMGVLSVRYRYKSLLLAGLAFLCISVLGCFVSPTFSFLLVVFPLAGLSRSMVQPMSQALIGALFWVDERPKILGYLWAGMALAYVIGSPVISFIGDWRFAFLLFVLPLAVVSLALAIIGIPSVAHRAASSQQYLQGFTAIFQNTSAIACVIANVLSVIAFQVLSFYSIPFYRQHFLIDKTFTSFLLSGVALIYSVGSVVGGKVSIATRTKKSNCFGCFVKRCTGTVIHERSVFMVVIDPVLYGWFFGEYAKCRVQ